MKFVVDECTGPAVAAWLRDLGHDVVSIHDEKPGADDSTVVALALEEERILVSNDKDFGEKVYREGYRHCGIILLRLADERSRNKIAVLDQVLRHHSGRLPNAFVVATEQRIRLADKGPR
ncbi:MAG: DUF5615 family PIN-like protein [Bacteroidota bacterium]